MILSHHNSVNALETGSSGENTPGHEVSHCNLPTEWNRRQFGLAVAALLSSVLLPGCDDSEEKEEEDDSESELKKSDEAFERDIDKLFEKRSNFGHKVGESDDDDGDKNDSCEKLDCFANGVAVGGIAGAILTLRVVYVILKSSLSRIFRRRG